MSDKPKNQLRNDIQGVTEEHASNNTFSRRNTELIRLTGSVINEIPFPLMFDKLALGISRLFPSLKLVIFTVAKEPQFSYYPCDAFPQQDMTVLEKDIRDYIDNSGGSHLDDGSGFRIGNRKVDLSRKYDSLFAFPIYEMNKFYCMFIVISPKNVSGDDHLLFKQHMQVTFETIIRLRSLQIIDSLSGLYNRDYLFERLKLILTERREGKSRNVGVVMIDIDYFKNINDSYGHRVGDLVISEMAGLISENIGENDIAARYGGDEMVVLIPDSDYEKTEMLANKLHSDIKAHVFERSGFTLHLTVSVGFVANDKQQEGDEFLLLDFADEALYLAKKSGRNQVKGIKKQFEQILPRSVRSEMVNENPLDGRGRVLIVDDEIDVIEFLERALEKADFKVISTTSAGECLDIIRTAADKIDVLIADVNMPDMDGIQLIEKTRNIDPNLVTLILSGFASSENAIAALRAGAYNFIKKPFSFKELEMTLGRAVERRRLRRQLDAYQLHLEEMLNNKTRALHTAIDDLKNSYLKTMEVIVNILDIYETNTAIHSRRVSNYALFLAEKIGIKDQKSLETIQYGALIHDIGKIGVPREILIKPDVLTEEEMDIMKQHSEIGWNIVRTIPVLKDAAEIVYAHHEYYNGQGYPRGLKGEEICVGARIFSLVDAFDTMFFGREYKGSTSCECLLKEINDCSGTQFDPAFVKVFNEYYKELVALEVESDSVWDKYTKL